MAEHELNLKISQQVNNLTGIGSGYTPTHATMTNNFVLQAPPAPTSNSLFMNHYNMQPQQ